MLLKIHIYFMWANNKMNTHFFMENKKDITEDLLAEFRSTGSNPAGKPVKIKQDSNKLPTRLEF